MPRSLASLVLVTALGLFALGCQPKIGDECVTDLDCSQAGDRLCDTTQPDGYCTQVDCDPVSCPEKESICIAFSDTISTQGSCNVKGQVSPYRRTFCMAVCEGSGDCRNGYACVDMSKSNEWGATVIQDDPDETRVCIEAMSFEPHGDDQEDEVCTGVPDDSSMGGAAN